MLSSATRKLRFWKKKPDKKEVTTEDELLLSEIEHQRKIINNLKQECVRLKDLQSDVEKYKMKFEVLERKTTQQTRSVEKQQSKLQSSLKMAEEEIERLSEELIMLRGIPCGGCEASVEEKKKYSLEISCLQDTILKLERDNFILQSLVREYTSQASRTKKNFPPILSSQNSIKSDPDIPLMRHDPLGKDKVRRSSLSLNDFLDDNIDVDTQSLKVEVEKSPGCSPFDGNPSDVGCFGEQTVSTSLKDIMNSQESSSTDDGCLSAIESLIENSKTIEVTNCTSDVATNFNSEASDLIHEHASNVLEKKHNDMILTKVVNIDTSRSLKNLVNISGKKLKRSNKYSVSCPSIDLYFNQPFQTAAEENFKKRRSLDDQNKFTKNFNNKICQSDLQKAVNFFGNDERNHSDRTKHKNITKDKVAALTEYFEGKNPKNLKQISPFKGSQPKPESPLVKKSPEIVKQQKPDSLKRLCSIPRLNGFHRITKSSPIKSPDLNTIVMNPSSLNVNSQPTSRDVRSASVPSPMLSNKCKESPQFKISFMKSTSLRSFNHLPLNKLPHSEPKPIEAQPSETVKFKKLRPPKKHKHPYKSPIINNLDKYKLNMNNFQKANYNPTKRLPALLVDVSEDASDVNLSNDEIYDDDPRSPKRCEVKSTNTQQKRNDTPETIVTNKRNMPSTPQPASCHCRSKTNKDLKSRAIRTNEIMPQTTSTNRSVDVKQQDDCGRVVQKDDIGTNQTYFYEVPSRKVQSSSIPVRSSKSSPTSNNLANSSLTSHPISPEQFMLPIDNCIKKPPPHLGMTHESPHQRSDEFPNPLNPRSLRDGRKNKVVHQNKSSERQKSTQDKRWNQCAKTTSDKTDRNNEITEKSTTPLKLSYKVRSSKQSSGTRAINPDDQVCDASREISRQLDILTSNK